MSVSVSVSICVALVAGPALALALADALGIEGPACRVFRLRAEVDTELQQAEA